MSDGVTKQQWDRFEALVARRDRLVLVGLTMERDLAVFGSFVAIRDDPHQSVDDLLDAMESHIVQLEGEFGS